MFGCNVSITNLSAMASLPTLYVFASSSNGFLELLLVNTLPFAKASLMMIVFPKALRRCSVLKVDCSKIFVSDLVTV